MAYDTCVKRNEFIINAFDPETLMLACALCGDSESNVLAHNNEARVVICKQCSLAFLSPRLSRDGYARFYREYFQDSRRSLATLDEAIQRLLRKGAYQNKMPIVEAFHGAIQTGDKGLEIGGGWGTLAKAFENVIGCSIEVVEPSPLAVRVAREYYGLTAYMGDGETFMRDSIGNKRYDFVLLIHVFEHVLDPNIFLESVKKTLKPNGKLLFALPDLSRPDEPSDKYFHIEHCYYYTPTTIELMLRKHEFKVCSVMQDANDMKIIAEYRDEFAISPDFKNNERLAIRMKIAWIDAVYSVLRMLKYPMKHIFPERFFSFIHQNAVRILKKSGIITGS